MLNPTVTAAYSSCFASNGNVHQPLSGFTPLDQDDQDEFTSDSPMSETEQLLEIDGLLKVEELIREIKKDGRFKSIAEEPVVHVDAHHARRLKDQ